ncbi:Hypothetical predicted protein [Lecanosticta acicola]|uniref:ESCRT-II complex subunit VPS25 n=1 Tax=Lecanosticta acicola TaxID=111012 RepID=A0AAI8Z4I4_9PEZI|nr:Hypothetical predicted protein [Lecanosticta acicola]
MSTEAPEPSLVGLSLSGSTAYAPSASGHSASSPTKTSNSTSFSFPPFAAFPPFYTLQPNLTTRARQLDLWSSLILSYCAYHRLFKLSLSSPPQDLFQNTSIKRSLKPNDIRAVLEYMSQSGRTVDFIPSASRSEQSNTCWVYWRSIGEWADTIYGWVDDTGQKGAVLTVYELREGEGVIGREWEGVEEEFLRKVLNVLVKRGKCQVFGQEEGAGVKFF